MCGGRSHNISTMVALGEELLRYWRHSIFLYIGLSSSYQDILVRNMKFIWLHLRLVTTFSSFYSLLRVQLCMLHS